MFHYVLAPLRLLRTLGSHRFMLGQLAWRAFASRYAGAVLGWVWTPLATAVQFVLYMVVFSVILGFLFGIPLGVLAAIYHNTFIDYGATFFAVLGQSVPNLVLGPVLIIVFAVSLNWLPVADVQGVWRSTLSNPGVMFTWDYISLAILPVFALGTGMMAGIARLTRASLLQVLREDYIRTARAKGLKEQAVIYGHALKNALIPVATILGPLLAGVLTGSFIIEQIFNIPGIGGEFVSSVSTRDYNLLVGVTIVYSVFLIAGNILVDVMYTWLDPRIRFD